MLLINEWMPNPAGRDGVTNEWIELANSGDEPIALSGWRIEAGGGKTFMLRSGELAPHAYLLLSRSQTKLSLINTAGKLVLKNPAGEVVQEGTFLGQAPEGKSANQVGGRFLFGEPTPGTTNAAPQTAFVAEHYPLHLPLQTGLGAGTFTVLGLVLAAILTAVILGMMKRNHDLQELFFGEN